jgi:protoheme IX farnesyltransferase
MSVAPSSINDPLSASATGVDRVAPVARRNSLGLVLQLTKARLSALVLMTTAVGFVLASAQSIDWMLLVWTVSGTALAAGCASALNQMWEVRLDHRMQRTHSRPLPSGAMSMPVAFALAVLMGGAGITLLAALVNMLAAGLALFTIVAYVFAYTPLKTRSTLNTLVGAVCGAIPPMIGWVAATGTLDAPAFVLGAILFVWQIPHFLALAWLYREDYARGGFAMLPVIDRDGRITCQVIVISTLLLMATALMATLANIAGPAYAMGSLAIGGWMLVLCSRLFRNRTNVNARRVFIASIVYLPVLLCMLVIDRGPVSGHSRSAAIAATIPTALTAAPVDE